MTPKMQKTYGPSNQKALTDLIWNDNMIHDDQPYLTEVLGKGTLSHERFNGRLNSVWKTSLEKRAPVLVRHAIVLDRGDLSCLDDSPPAVKVKIPKKRGRHVMSSALENYLVNKIKEESVCGTQMPTRTMIAELARSFIKENNLKLQCSKGWLDKFMRRNGKLIKGTAPGN